MSDNQKSHIWKLAYLEQELDDIANKLDSVASGLDLSAADHGLYEALLRQINRCHGHLDSALSHPAH